MFCTLMNILTLLDDPLRCEISLTSWWITQTLIETKHSIIKNGYDEKHYIFESETTNFYVGHVYCEHVWKVHDTLPKPFDHSNKTHWTKEGQMMTKGIGSYISICMWMCMCAYQYHIKTDMNIRSVFIHAYAYALSVLITIGSNSNGSCLHILASSKARSPYVM